jgi:hypothetical protein
VLSPSNPVDVTEALDVSNAKLIGGQVIGSLRFESREHERGFLSEAGDSFCFPLMEQRLMRAWAGHALRCEEDLTLKSYVAARCARRQLGVKRGEPS